MSGYISLEEHGRVEFSNKYLFIDEYGNYRSVPRAMLEDPIAEYAYDHVLACIGPPGDLWRYMPRLSDAELREDLKFRRSLPYRVGIDRPAKAVVATYRDDNE